MNHEPSIDRGDWGSVVDFGRRALAAWIAYGPGVYEGRKAGPSHWLSGVGLCWRPLTPNGLNQGKAQFPEFHSVYIEPENLRFYQKHGNFPEGTVIVKELALTQPGKYPDGSLDSASGRGYFPSALHGLDVMVKDSKRFGTTNNWGFFTFGHHAPPYEPAANVMSSTECAYCHVAGVAKTDMVWVQFYPLLSAELQ